MRNHRGGFRGGAECSVPEPAAARYNQIEERKFCRFTSVRANPMSGKEIVFLACRLFVIGRSRVQLSPSAPITCQL